jgi:hypothetical protein
MSTAAVIRDGVTLAALGQVKTDSLMPAQQPSSQKILTAADTYQQRLLKYPLRATFHSYAEFIHALWLESRADVRSFVPQPFLLWVNGRRYIPDCYVVLDTGPEVVELKAGGTMVNPPPELVRRFFEWENLAFEVLDNAEVLTHEAEALHWLRLIQVLVVAAHYHVDTRAEETTLLQVCAERGPQTLGNLISPRRHAQQYPWEVALYRLLHQHRLATDLVTRPLDYDAEIRLCN